MNSALPTGLGEDFVFMPNAPKYEFEEYVQCNTFSYTRNPNLSCLPNYYALITMEKRS